MNPQIIATLMVVQGVAMGIVSGVMYRKARTKVATWHRTSGEVIEVVEGHEDTKHPVIRYQTTTGEEVTFRSKFGRSSWKVKVGDRLEILVNPKDPQDAEVVSFMVQWGFCVILGISAVGAIALAPWIPYFFRW